MHQLGASTNGDDWPYAPIVFELAINKDDHCEYQLYAHNS